MVVSSDSSIAEIWTVIYRKKNNPFRNTCSLVVEQEI